MKENGLFFSEGAYQWAEKFIEKAHQKPVDLDFKETARLLREGDYFDQEMFLFESCENGKPPLMMLENVDDKKKKSIVLTFPLTTSSYETFKEEYFDLAQILLMHGRLAYRKEFALGRADLPRITIRL